MTVSIGGRYDTVSASPEVDQASRKRQEDRVGESGMSYSSQYHTQYQRGFEGDLKPPRKQIPITQQASIGVSAALKRNDSQATKGMYMSPRKFG